MKLSSMAFGTVAALFIYAAAVVGFYHLTGDVYAIMALPIGLLAFLGGSMAFDALRKR